MANTLITLLNEHGYTNTGDNRSYAIKSINNLLDSGFLQLKFVSYEKAKEGYGYIYETKDGKKRRTLYKVTIFGKTYFGHWMPQFTNVHIGWGFGVDKRENEYKCLDLYSILCRIARLISINKNGFDFLKDESSYKNGACSCTKCHGTGFIPAFAHYAEGVCFDCGGTGINSNTLKMYIEKNINK